MPVKLRCSSLVHKDGRRVSLFVANVVFGATSGSYVHSSDGFEMQAKVCEP